MTAGGAPDVSAVVVNHRSAEECAECVRSLRRVFASDGVGGEIVVVDCGSGPEDVERLAALKADAFVPLADNRGYSGGLNAGLARARGGTLLLCNADVVFHDGAVGALRRAVEDPRVGAAAPRAAWDAEGKIFLPPGDATGFFRDLAKLRAGTHPRRDDRRFAAFARECLRLWTRGGAARQLVGVVLAARRDVFDRVGRLDERFPFEYEETEWEERVRAAGLRLMFVPEAHIRHLWGRSASRNPETGERRAASKRAYRERRYGRAGRRILELAERPSLPPDARRVERPELPPRPGAWAAFSPSRSRIPFAGAPLSDGFRLPREIETGLAAGPWSLTAFRESDGQPLETVVWEKRA